VKTTGNIKSALADIVDVVWSYSSGCYFARDVAPSPAWYQLVLSCCTFWKAGQE
jgi:hypothetical protein